MSKVQKFKSDSKAMGSTAAQHSFERFNSASRTAMGVSQWAQTTEPMIPDYPRIMTGYETQLADHTLCAKMPCDGTVYGVLNKYTVGSGLNAIRKNYEKTVLFTSEETGELDVIELKSSDSPHDVFGFDLKETGIVRQLRHGLPVAKGTRLNQPRSILEGNVSSSIIQANFAYISHAPVIEDGMWVSESFTERCRPKAFYKCTFEYGSRFYPLNLYGGPDSFKAHPGPGEKVMDSGLICASRRKDEIFDMVGMLPDQLTKPSRFDQKIYVPPEAFDVTVDDVDIVTTVNDSNRLAQTPVGMEEYSRIFTTQKSKYYDRLLELYDGFMRSTNFKGAISPRLTNLLTDAYADKPNDPRARFGRDKKGSIQRINRGTPIDEWMINLKMSWLFRLGNGAKGSNQHGSKGVFVRIVPDEDMPTDDYGRRCDVVIYGGSTIARLNGGQYYEQYVNACGDFVAMDIQKMLEAGKEEKAWDFLYGWYGIASPETQAIMNGKTTALARRKHLKLVVEHKPHIIIPDDNDYVGVEWIKALRAYRAPGKTPVTFRNLDGKMVRTRVPVLIGSAAWITLDKSSFKPMAVAVAKRQGHGLPSTLNKVSKASNPTNAKASRGYAEAEIRAIVSACTGKAAMDVVDLSVNPEALSQLLVKAWHAPNVMQMRNIIDREKIPYGSGRSVGLPMHLFNCISVSMTEAK